MRLEDIAALHALCFPDAPWPQDSFATLLDQPMVHLVTVEHGFLVATIIHPEAEILTLCVHPEHRRQGKAGLLLDLLAQDVDSMFLEVAEDNVAALEMYRGQGFVETGRRTGYYARPGGAKVDALTMSCHTTQR
jgi:ribosomal-protein-alanine N-acetyltransferase